MENIENMDLNQVFDVIDKYVKLNFLARLLTSHASKSAEEFNSNVFDIDFKQLGLSEEAVKVLSEKANIVNLKRFKDEIFSLAEYASTQIFGCMTRLSNDDKIAIKEHVDSMLASYLDKSSECQDTYLGLVVEIDQSTKKENSSKTRALGKMAKASFNRIYEYNIICQYYSNISSYLRGMIKSRGLN